jgi:hypothetical protein
MPSKTHASAAGGRSVGDFSEITVGNQSKRDFMSRCLPRRLTAATFLTALTVLTRLTALTADRIDIVDIVDGESQ